MVSSRSRFGSHRRASLLVRAIICIQAVISAARVTTAHQIWFYAAAPRTYKMGMAVLVEPDPATTRDEPPHPRRRAALNDGPPAAEPITSRTMKHPG